MIAKTLKALSWLVIVGLVILTIVPADERPLTGLQHDLEHFVAFGLTGFLFGLAHAGYFRLLCLYAILFTLALELSQIPLATRHARVEDFIVDAVGACLGIAAAYAFQTLMKNRAAAAG
jgi:VanZ family protein